MEQVRKSLLHSTVIILYKYQVLINYNNAFWKCPDCGHTWQAPVCQRTQGRFSHHCKENWFKNSSINKCPRIQHRYTPRTILIIISNHFRNLPAVPIGEYDPTVAVDGGVVDVTQPQAIGVFERKCGAVDFQQKSLEGRALTGAVISEAMFLFILIFQAVVLLGNLRPCISWTISWIIS